MDKQPASGESVHEASHATNLLGISLAEDAAPSMVFVVDLDGQVVQRTQHIPLATSDGRRRPFQWSANALTAADGTVTGTIFIGTDMSEQRRVETQLAEERERHQTILALTLDGVITLDKEGIIGSLNPSAEEMFGGAQQELVGRPLSLLIPSLMAENQLAAGLPMSSLESLLGVGRELEVRRLDGTAFPCSFSLAKVQLGDSISFCGTFCNRSESKRMEEQLRQSMKMEAVGRLASGVAHDFNNLLMGISGCASVAMESLDSGQSNQMYLAEIKKAAASGTAMTKQLLAFGRKANLESVVFDLDARISAQQGLLRRLLGEDIELSVRLEADDAPIRADVGQVDQVLMNLAANARDAMPHGGRLRIETEVVRHDNSSYAETGHLDPVEPLPDGSYVALRVSDSGCGMSLATRSHAFDPFYTTKDPGRGTGLGLATVNEIVKQLGGRIYLHSSEGVGTLFEILLPLSADEKTPPPGESSRPKRIAPVRREERRSRTILLCEDDRLVRLTVRYYLEAAGYGVLKAECGADAIETCRRSSRPIDLLLTDVVLPDQSGERIAHEIRKLCPAIKVLYMSAHSQEWLHSEGRVDSALETLQKPFDSAFLLDRIIKVFEPEAGASTSCASILVVEDSDPARLAIVQCLKEEGWSVHGAANGSEARKLMNNAEKAFDVLLVDYSLPDTTGNLLAAEMRVAMPKIAVAYMSGYSGLILDPPGPLLVKPIELEALSTTIRSMMTRAVDENEGTQTP